MTRRHLVDTDWVIHYFRGHASISERLNGLFGSGLALSIVSVAELYEGVVNSVDPAKSERVLQGFVDRVELIGIDDLTCRLFAQHRARLRKARSMIGDFDLMIGATALGHGLTVLTNNRRHFERITGLEIESA